jgi:drug/metabolite transporter (DMT)-like permease
MSLEGFLLILLSAFFHVLWNTFLKGAEDKTSAIVGIMVLAAAGMSAYAWLTGEAAGALVPGVLLSAVVAGFFFFLYQYYVARALNLGDLSRIYPLTVTGPIYIAVWSYFLLQERISLAGGLGILLIIYGAVSIQTNSLRLPVRRILGRDLKHSGALFALMAAFFYSFGAVADKIGVSVGRVSAYTTDLCLVMALFHIVFAALQSRARTALKRIVARPLPVLAGGVALMLSFITFRYGLEQVYASYASALRQVSTLFGIGIGYFVFREPFGTPRVLGTLIIVLGAAGLKLG